MIFVAEPDYAVAALNIIICRDRWTGVVVLCCFFRIADFRVSHDGLMVAELRRDYRRDPAALAHQLSAKGIPDADNRCPV